jgi:hypothetical protein
MATDTPKFDASWSVAQVADRLVEELILNRPARSRWHPDYRDAFAHLLLGPGAGTKP